MEFQKPQLTNLLKTSKPKSNTLSNQSKSQIKFRKLFIFISQSKKKKKCRPLRTLGINGPKLSELIRRHSFLHVHDLPKRRRRRPIHGATVPMPRPCNNLLRFRSVPNRIRSVSGSARPVPELVDVNVRREQVVLRPDFLEARRRRPAGERIGRRQVHHVVRQPETDLRVDSTVAIAAGADEQRGGRRGGRRGGCGGGGSGGRRRRRR